MEEGFRPFKATKGFLEAILGQQKMMQRGKDKEAAILQKEGNRSRRKWEAMQVLSLDVPRVWIGSIDEMVPPPACRGLTSVFNDKLRWVNGKEDAWGTWADAKLLPPNFCVHASPLSCEPE
jgi:hypothetical protein